MPQILIAISFVFLFPSLAWSGSGAPLTERQASDLIMGAASSESIKGPPIGMEQACNDLKYDIQTIARALSDGEPIEQMKALANRSLSVLGQERLDRILEMLDEAYAWDKPLVEWMNKRYGKCMGV